MPSKNYQRIFLLLQIATACVFLGRAWQHIVWDAPFRALLWDENIMSSVLPIFSSISYEDFISDINIDDQIQISIQAVGWFYMFCALVVIFIRKIPKWFSYILWLGSLSLIILAFLYCKEKFYQWGQFWEYSLQFGAPLFLFFLFQKKEVSLRIIFWMKVAIAITFISHGLYALNYYPRPGQFVDMTINILGVGEETAFQFLNAVGILDFIVAIALFLPNKISKYALIYIVLWGLATTVARIWGHFYIDMIGDTLSLWVHESVYRFPHFLIPLAVLAWTLSIQKTRATSVI